MIDVQGPPTAMTLEAAAIAALLGILGIVAPMVVVWPALIMLYPICFGAGFFLGRRSEH